MLDLKSLHPESLPKAIEKAKQYRLLNEPWQAESICRDILQVSENHQEAILNLILAITDQFDSSRRRNDREAKQLCEQLESKYERLYYRGLIAERMGKAILKRTTPRAKYIAYEYFRAALDLYQEAEKLAPDDNEETILRWNACVRTIQSQKLQRAPEEDQIQPFLDV